MAQIAISSSSVPFDPPGERRTATFRQRALRALRALSGAARRTDGRGGPDRDDAGRGSERLPEFRDYRSAAAWAKRDGTGVAFDSATGFVLPNGAMRSPDAARVPRSRLEPLSDEKRQRFLPLCPDFVVELRSPSDRLTDLQDKMDEYRDNGARVGWLVDPQERRIHVYRPGQPVGVLAAPSQISGDPELPGFVLDLGPIWQGW